MMPCSIIMGHILKDLKQTQKGRDEMRVVQGGVVGLGSSDARSSMRLYLPPSDRFGLAGFRLARTP